ncbi:TetR family transcriptional regulator [Paraburkholderia agricolaris]|uniref:TetR family transcriptional regulator n=1 Tax=Paraburkholderia agricolaris TaxID=2152888 RepID=A0ABW9A1E5_9BURK
MNRKRETVEMATEPASVPRAGARRSVVPPGATRRPDRRQDILYSAERLFSSKGYHRVSLRDIATDANVPLALVGYYFGKKDELFRTIFERRKEYIEERITAIAEVDCSLANTEAVRTVIATWVQPVVDLRASEHGEWFSVLVARAIWEPGDETTNIVKTFYDPLANVFIDTMSRVLPSCTRDQIVWGYEFAVGALLMLIADRRVERLSLHGAKSGDPAQVERLIDFLNAGFLSIARRSTE